MARAWARLLPVLLVTEELSNVYHAFPFVTKNVGFWSILPRAVLTLIKNEETPVWTSLDKERLKLDDVLIVPTGDTQDDVVDALENAGFKIAEVPPQIVALLLEYGFGRCLSQETVRVELLVSLSEHAVFGINSLTRSIRNYATMARPTCQLP